MNILTTFTEKAITPYGSNLDVDKNCANFAVDVDVTMSYNKIMCTGLPTCLAFYRDK